MTLPRKYLIDYSKTRYYHCTSRCVRQDYLLDYSSIDEPQSQYRHKWILERLMLLSEAFCIDVYAFSIMDNHTHLVLGANTELAKSLSNKSVLQRWSKIGSIPNYCHAYLSYSDEGKESVGDLANEKIAIYKSRLADISWFMKYFNEYIARRANKEEEVKGHFWEARFSSQALLDSKALLNCMAYVDLNPVKAGKASSLEGSNFTSIQKRVGEFKRYRKDVKNIIPLNSISKPEKYTNLPFSMSLQTYISYVGSAKTMLEKKAFVFDEVANSKERLRPVFYFETMYGHFAGNKDLIEKTKKEVAKKMLKNNAIESDAKTVSPDLSLGIQYLIGKKRLSK